MSAAKFTQVLHNYELLYPALAEFAIAVEQNGTQALRELKADEHVTPAEARKIQDIIAKQTELIETLIPRIIKLDAQFLRAIGEDVSDWVENYPELR